MDVLFVRSGGTYGDVQTDGLLCRAVSRVYVMVVGIHNEHVVSINVIPLVAVALVGIQVNDHHLPHSQS